MAQTGRQFVNYAFYKLDPAWRRLPLEQRESSKRELIEVIDRFSADLLVRSYSLVGIRGDADLMLWRVTEDVAYLMAGALWTAARRISTAEILEGDARQPLSRARAEALV